MEETFNWMDIPRQPDCKICACTTLNVRSEKDWPSAKSSGICWTTGFGRYPWCYRHKINQQNPVSMRVAGCWNNWVGETLSQGRAGNAFGGMRPRG